MQPQLAVPPDQGDACQGLRAERHGDVAAGAHSEIAHQRGVFLQELELFGAQLRIALLHVQNFLGSKLPTKAILTMRKPSEPMLETVSAMYTSMP